MASPLRFLKPCAPFACAIGLCACALSLCACAPTVLTQPVPVSTDPPGASVSVDGKPGCTAPCQLELARNQDHILTVSKEGYRQQDVLIKRQYQSTKVLINAINEGARSADFFKNATWGMSGGVQSMRSQEETGEAYVLSPSAVSLRLVPTAGFAAKGGAQTEAGLSPLDIMDVGDQQMLEGALERSRSGGTTSWRNTTSGAVFSVVPEPAEEHSGGEIVRWFALAAKLDGRTASARYPAVRVGQGEWAVRLPAKTPQNAAASGQTQGTGAPDKGAEDLSRQETLRALGQAPWPTASKTWDAGSSSRTNTVTTPTPGGYSSTTTTTKTSTKVGVSVGPGALIEAIGALQGADSK